MHNLRHVLGEQHLIARRLPGDVLLQRVPGHRRVLVFAQPVIFEHDHAPIVGAPQEIDAERIVRVVEVLELALHFGNHEPRADDRRVHQRFAAILRERIRVGQHAFDARMVDAPAGAVRAQLAFRQPVGQHMVDDLHRRFECAEHHGIHHRAWQGCGAHAIDDDRLITAHEYPAQWLPRITHGHGRGRCVAACAIALPAVWIAAGVRACDGDQPFMHGPRVRQPMRLHRGFAGGRPAMGELERAQYMEVALAAVHCLPWFGGAVQVDVWADHQPLPAHVLQPTLHRARCADDAPLFRGSLPYQGIDLHSGRSAHAGTLLHPPRRWPARTPAVVERPLRLCKCG